MWDFGVAAPKQAFGSGCAGGGEATVGKLVDGRGARISNVFQDTASYQMNFKSAFDFVVDL